MRQQRQCRRLGGRRSSSDAGAAAAGAAAGAGRPPPEEPREREREGPYCPLVAAASVPGRRACRARSASCPSPPSRLLLPHTSRASGLLSRAGMVRFPSSTRGRESSSARSSSAAVRGGGSEGGRKSWIIKGARNAAETCGGTRRPRPGGWGRTPG